MEPHAPPCRFKQDLLQAACATLKRDDVERSAALQLSAALLSKDAWQLSSYLLALSTEMLQRSTEVTAACRGDDLTAAFLAERAAELQAAAVVLAPNPKIAQYGSAPAMYKAMTAASNALSQAVVRYIKAGGDSAAADRAMRVMDELAASLQRCWQV
jgi:hypothetical protein